MTISELQILLDINKGNECALLKEHAFWTSYGYLFVDSEDGQCYLFDENGNLDSIKKIDVMLNGYVKKDIKKIVIPKGVKFIGGYAFMNCTSLTSIKILESVKSIGDWAFFNCKSLTNIKIPDSIESIGYKAFAFCESLASVEIPESVESIRYWAFGNCTSLISIIFKGKIMDQVKEMDYYPWGIEDESIIKAQS